MKYVVDENFQSDDPEEILRWLKEQLREVEEALKSPPVESMLFTSRHKQPVKLIEGLVLLADGTDYEPVPGGGAGLYRYQGGAWTKIG